MSANDIFTDTLRLMRRTAADLGSPTRGEWQRAIENQLQSFAADAVEAMELLDALIASLNTRYDRGQLADVEHEFKQLREALDELDKTTCENNNVVDDCDAWHEWQARHDEP